MACGLPNGCVYLIDIREHLDGSVSTYMQRDQPFEADGRIITELSWIRTSSDSMTLVKCTPGLIEVHKPDDDHLSKWHGTRVFRVPSLSAATSILQSVSGLTFHRKNDTLIFSLASGSIYALSNFSINPNFDILESNRLSGIAHKTFVEVEARDVKPTGMNAINGLISWDVLDSFAWIHE